MTTPSNSHPSRRAFLKTSCATAAALGMAANTQFADAAEETKNAIPRWRGFNLLEFFQALDRWGSRSSGMVQEDDFRFIRDWGFDFARIPMDYWLWIDSDCRETGKLDPADLLKIDEKQLEKVDRVVELGGKHDVHVSLNFHRAPGYCINNPEREPVVLWTDEAAEEAFVYHWDVFAKRYAHVPAEKLSFNLVNEAPGVREGYMSAEDYRRVMTAATEAIRKHTPDRVIIIDGLSVGNKVVENMIPTGVAQSVHAYSPAEISHYRASWVDKNNSFPEPTWPLLKSDGSVKYGREQLEAHYKPWGELVKQGVGVHCGEGGAYNKTPHDVFLAWMTDVMDILHGHGIGWSLWELRGSFGVLDSGRADVDYQDYHGHKLDSKLLAVLQKH